MDQALGQGADEYLVVQISAAQGFFSRRFICCLFCIVYFGAVAYWWLGLEALVWFWVANTHNLRRMSLPTTTSFQINPG